MTSKKLLQCEIAVTKIMVTLCLLALLAFLSPPQKSAGQSGVTMFPAMISQDQPTIDAQLFSLFLAKPLLLSMNPDSNDILNHATNMQGIPESKSVVVKNGQIVLYSEEQAVEQDTSNRRANKKMCKGNSVC